MSAKDFQVITKLGEGAYSIVYKVLRASDNQEYAMKKVKLGNLSDKEKENALNEVRILASIKSPYVVGYKEAFFEDDSMTLCIVMEYASGGDMYHKITQHQKSKTYMQESDVWRHATQMILGLKSLHDLRILHRDLKCANVFLSKDSECAKLGDLNVSKVAKNNLVYTQTGTPYYASPEVWRDQPYNLKSDIWSLGCVLYEMCALHPPFRANDMKGLFQKVQKGQFERIPSQYSSDLHSLISLCLQVSASMRPNCDQLLAHPLLQKYGRNALKTPMAPPENNELLSTIRIPRNFKALAKQLPKPNYSHDISHSVDLKEENLPKESEGMKDTIRTRSKRAISQNALPSRGRIQIQKPQSRDIKAIPVQNVVPVPPKESERDYLDRMQNEYLERAKVIRTKDLERAKDLDKLPDLTKVRPRVSSQQSILGPITPEYNEYRSNQDPKKILEPRRVNEAYNQMRIEARNYIEKGIPQVPIYREESEPSLYKGKVYHIMNRYDANKSRENNYPSAQNLSRVSSESMSLIEKRADYLLNKYKIGDGNHGMSYRNDLELYQPGSNSSIRNDSRTVGLDSLEQYNNLYNMRKNSNQVVISSRGRDGTQLTYDTKNYNSQPYAAGERKRYYY